MIFADTGWFVALVNTTDALHHRALAWLRSSDEPIATTEYVLLETFNGLSGTLARQRCHELIPRVLSQLHVVVQRADPVLFERGMQLHRDRKDKEWSLTDCISFVMMKELGIVAALAHDHHFEQAGFEALMRRDPDKA